MIIPNNLIRQVISGKVVPFIGAGFSRYFGYPGWNELLIKVKDAIGVTDLNNDDIQNVDPLQLGQSLLDYYKEKNYSECEKKILEKLGMENNNGTEDRINEYLSKIIKEEINLELEREFSKLVLSFIQSEDANVDEIGKAKLSLLGDVDFRCVITTNYDKVLENDIFAGRGYVPLPLGQGTELNWNESDKAIYKIHGDVDYCEEIIFTHSQYYKFMHEFSYFKSKLYTLFSNNVILMMGYGFNDINIHQIYFQFIRDYNSKISDDKFYMVLTDYDKEKWGSYFNYYKRFLKSYKINVIEVDNLPNFVKELAEQVKIEKSSTDLSSLLEYYQELDQHNFTKVLLDVVNNQDSKVYHNKELNKNLLIAFHKIYKGPYILTRPPFNKEVVGDTLDPDIAYSIFNYIKKITEEDNYLLETEEYFNIVNDSLDYICKTNDFYGINTRVSFFIDFSNKVNKDGFDLEIGEKVYNMFSSCHPTEYLRSNPGGRTLQSNLTKIGDFYIKSYLHYIINELEEEVLPNRIQRFWIDQLYKQYNPVKEIKDLINSIKEKYQSLKEQLTY
jgi:hypothetical protein